MYKNTLALGISLGFAAVTIAAMLPQIGSADEVIETRTTGDLGGTIIERREVVPMETPVIEQRVIEERPVIVRTKRHHLLHLGVPGAHVNVL